MTPKKIIDADKAVLKLNRIAYQILEENYKAKELYVIGVSNRGYKLAKLIVKRLKKIGDIPVKLSSVTLNKTNPVKDAVELGDPDISFKNKTVILIDDVGNTGRTLYYAMQPLSEHLPASIQAAVLVDRMHKSFPIKVNYVGLSLATTLNEEVIVEFDDKNEVEGAYLY